MYNPVDTAISALYVHFPFCEAKCHYCDFYSLPSKDKDTRQADYWKVFEIEAKHANTLLAPKLRSIYFGGGTPSTVDIGIFEKVVKGLQIPSRLDGNTEWTLEVNPSSVSKESLAQYRSLGINRLSIGIQSTSDQLLQWLGRKHDRKRAFQALEWAFAAEFTNVSVDLMCGIPGQDERTLEESLTSLSNYPITHLSCYLLTLHDGHPAQHALPSEEIQLSHFLFVDSFLKTRGFQHYEISNFCKPSRQSIHNMNYWKGGSYLSLGPSAHSFDALAGKRWKNYSSIEEYISKILARTSPVEWEEVLTEKQKELEKWMLALRLDEGVPASWFADSQKKVKLSSLLQSELAEIHPSDPRNVRLTARGLCLCDKIIADLTD